ncbi:hypothetical protein BC835DRAFT_1309995 [Cytidiella melzeri]|nr:hypothetical protein BC835DRAFT_1309995 [Cytidiella melzeri]
MATIVMGLLAQSTGTIEVNVAVPLVTRCNPNLVCCAPPHLATPVLTQEEVSLTPRRPLASRAHLQALTPPTSTPVAGFEAVRGKLQAPLTNRSASKQNIVKVPDDNNNNVVEQEPPKKFRAVRPRASDIEDLVRRGIMIQACTNFRVALATEDAFPGVDADNMAMIAFMEACEQKGMCEAVNIEEKDLKLIKGRASQLRGEVVTLARARVKFHYHFLDKDNTTLTLGKNCEKYRALTDWNAFIYKDPASREPGTLFRNQLLQDVLNQAFFRNAKDEDIVYRSCFNASEGGIPLPTIALIITAIDCAISEFRTGEHIQQEFMEKMFTKQYRNYRTTLENWKKYTVKQGTLSAAQVQRKMYRLACIHAGVDENADDTITSTLSITNFAADKDTPNTV